VPLATWVDWTLTRTVDEVVKDSGRFHRDDGWPEAGLPVAVRVGDGPIGNVDDAGRAAVSHLANRLSH
jgi:hypothetical protein